MELSQLTVEEVNYVVPMNNHATVGNLLIYLNPLGVLFLILMVFGFTAIIFSYLLSLFPSSVAGGFSLVTVIHVFSGTSWDLNESNNL